MCARAFDRADLTHLSGRGYACTERPHRRAPSSTMRSVRARAAARVRIGARTRPRGPGAGAHTNIHTATRRAPGCTPPSELEDVVPRGSTGARTRPRAVIMSYSMQSSGVRRAHGEPMERARSCTCTSTPRARLSPGVDLGHHVGITERCPHSPAPLSAPASASVCARGTTRSVPSAC